MTKKKKRNILPRLYAGLYSICNQPFKVIFLLLLTILYYKIGELIISHLSVLFSNHFPLVNKILYYSIIILLIEIFILLFTSLFLILGTPITSKKIEQKLLDANFPSQNQNPPLLIQNKKIKNSNYRELIFYSPGIPLRKWIEEKDLIESALNMHYVKMPTHKDSLSHIMLTVAPGVKKSREDVLYDEEL